MMSENSTLQRVALPLLAIVIIFIGSISAGAAYLFVLLLSPFLIDPKRIQGNSSALFYSLVICSSLIFCFHNAFYTSFSLYFVEIIKIFALLLFSLIFSKLTAEQIRVVYQLILYFIFFNILSFNYDVEGRLSGFFIHANHLAYFTTFSLLLAFSMFNSYKLVFSLMLLLLTVILTKSSGGIIMSSIIVFVSFIYKYKVSLALIIKLFIMSLVVIFLSIYSGVYEILLYKIGGVDFVSVFDKANSHSFGSDGSLVWRFTYGIAILNDFNFQSFITKLFGEGLGTMTYGNYAYSFMLKDPHNDYIRLIVERGYLGAISVAIIFAYSFRKLNNKFLIYTALALPMASGNVIVSFPSMALFILIVIFYEKNSFNYSCKK